MRILLSLAIWIASLPSSAFAADVEGLTRLFHTEFVRGYRSGKCQYNTRFFTQKAHEAGIDLSGALYFTATGSGDVSYYYGRSGPGGQPQSGIWFHHYFLVVPTDGRSDAEFAVDRNYVVIDFDYGNTPQIVDLRTYLRDMFMAKSMRDDESKIEKDFGLALLRFTAHDAHRLVSQLDPNGEFPRGTEKESLILDNLRFKPLYQELSKQR